MAIDFMNIPERGRGTLIEVNVCSKVVLKLKCKKNSRSVGVLFKTNVLFTTHIHKAGLNNYGDLTSFMSAGQGCSLNKVHWSLGPYSVVVVHK